MGLPALFSPESWVLPKSLPPVEPSALTELSATVRGLLDEARKLRPVENSPEEGALLKRVALFGYRCMRLLGPDFLAVQRFNLNEALGDLVRKELAAAEPERKLALRHIEHAVHSYGVLTEAFCAALSGLPPGSFLGLVQGLAQEIEAGTLPVTEGDRMVLRLQLDVMVALDVLDAPLPELTTWAFQAITSARRVEALSPSASGIQGELRAELARLRARRSWMSWDAAELAEELAPWPGPSR